MADLGSVLPEYELLGELGRGAMGVVVLARHRSLGRPVAIKELPPAFAADELVRRRFLREARTVASLDHPHVVVVHDFVDRDGHLALIMEQLAGGTVWDRFTGRGLTAPTACALVLATAAGLDEAHRNGVLHRDVKPENLMFTQGGQLKVTDFGMAKVMGGEKTLATADGVVLGTPAYMAPEQAEGITVGPPADVYACGTVLFELLSGRLPFAEAPTPMAMLVRRIATEPPRLAEAAPAVDPRLAAVVDRALARTPTERYPEVVDLGVDLAAAATACWGPDWVEATGVSIAGCRAIERAIRRSGPAAGWSAPRAGTALGERSGELGDAVGPSSFDRRGELGDAVGPSSFDPRGEAADATDPPTGHRRGEPVDGAPPSAEVTAAMAWPAAESTRVVAAQPHRPPPVDLRSVTLGDLVDIAEVNRPTRAALPALVAVVASLAVVALAMLGSAATGVSGPAGERDEATQSGVVTVSGRPTGSGPVEVDFSQPILVDGVGPGDRLRVDASSWGIPLGSVEADVRNGRAEVDPSYLQWTTAGEVELALVVDDAATSQVEVAAMATQPWWSTAPALVALVIALSALAGARAELRGFRSGRFRVAGSIALAISGATLGALAVGAAFVGRGQAVPGDLVVLGAVAGAVALVAGGEWRRRTATPAVGFTVLVDR